MPKKERSRAAQLDAIKQKLEKQLPEMVVHLQYKPPIFGRQPQVLVTIANREQDPQTQLEFGFDFLKRLALEENALPRKRRPTPYTWRDLLHLFETVHHLQTQS